LNQRLQLGLTMFLFIFVKGPAWSAISTLWNHEALDAKIDFKLSQFS